MLRKTVSLNEELVTMIEEEGVLSHYRNFSELVSEALKREIERYRLKRYEEEIEMMSQDPMVQEDIAEIEEAFRISDSDHAI